VFVAAAAAQASSSTARSISRESYETRLFQLLNAERSRYGLRPLARARCATGFASRWAERLANDQWLRHQSVHRVLASCEARRAAENIAMGGVTPERMIRMWMQSRPHRANILDPRLTHVGLGARPASNGDWYAVQVFLGY